jgi:hypothetical protein
MSTLGEIIERFRFETRDFSRICSAEAIGDGLSLFFQIPDYPIVEGTLFQRWQLVPEGGTPTALATDDNFELDYESGQLKLTGDWITTPPTAQTKLLWSWKWTHWSQAEVVRLINAGVRFLGQSYEIETEDDTLTTETGTYEYAVDAGVKRITKVELRRDSSCRWKTVRNWRTKSTAGVPRIAFSFDLGNMEMRVTTISRPSLFALTEPETEPGTEPEEDPEGGAGDIPPVYGAGGSESGYGSVPPWEGLVDQTLEDTGLPEEAIEPLLWYAIWMAYEGQLIHRSRDDAAQHAKEEVTITMRDLESRAAKIKTIFDLHYSHFQTELINGRLIP